MTEDSPHEPESLDRKAAYAKRRAEMRARTEAKNEAVRQSLEPIAPDELPRVIAISALVAGCSALAFWVSAGIAAFGDVTVAGVRQPSPLVMAAIAAALTWVAVGVWRKNYGATLAFQGFTVFVILASALGLVLANTWLEAISSLLILAGTSYLFYKLIRTMARMQAPPEPK